jgi:hypothetical protein
VNGSQALAIKSTIYSILIIGIRMGCPQVPLWELFIEGMQVLLYEKVDVWTALIEAQVVISNVMPLLLFCCHPGYKIHIVAGRGTVEKLCLAVNGSVHSSLTCPQTPSLSVILSHAYRRNLSQPTGTGISWSQVPIAHYSPQHLCMVSIVSSCPLFTFTHKTVQTVWQ